MPTVDASKLTREAILSLTPDQMLRLLRRLGIEIDQRALADASDAIYSRVGYATREGYDDLDPETWAMVEKQIDRAFNDALRRQVKGAVRDARIAALVASEPAPTTMRDPETRAYARAPAAPRTYVWVATMTNTCDSCVRRHGEVKTMAEWQGEGLPGAPVLICNGNCNCTLLPFSAKPGEDVYVDILAALEVTVEVKGARR